MKPLLIISILLIICSCASVVQKKYPLVEMRQGKVYLETGRLRLDSVAVYFSDGQLISKKHFVNTVNPELPPVFSKPGEYTLIFSVKNKSKIIRKLIVL